MWEYRHTDELYHYGVPGMRWGKRKARGYTGGFAGMIRRKQMIKSADRLRLAKQQSKQADRELNELKGYAKNPQGLAKSKLSTAIRNHQIKSLQKEKKSLNSRMKEEQSIMKELKDIDSYKRKEYAKKQANKQKIASAKEAYKQAKKTYSKAYDKAHNYSATHMISQYGKNKQESDSRWGNAYDAANAAEKARKAYKAAKKRYR